MAGRLNAKVIMAKCSSTGRAFGIRIEKRGRDWVRTWAFPIDERKAKHEGFDANTVSGSMDADDEYPGCPHCGNKGFVQCSCEKISCMGGRNHSAYADFTCPWCRESSKLEDRSSFDVSSGDY